MPIVKEPHAEPIPGYRLIAPLGSGGFGEVWKCEAPGGLFKAIKFVHGNTNSLEANRARAAEELRAVQHLKAIRHPFLLSMDRVEQIHGELVIVMELADQNLHEVMARYQREGRLGIPRPELLGYLREAAEVLDLMNHEHHLQHLDVKPRNLFLVHKHVKVADFGLVSSLGTNEGNSSQVQRNAITPSDGRNSRYSAPELFEGQVSRACDQYSLALIYHEMLTGTHALSDSVLPRGSSHANAEPDLGRLPERERDVLARALAPEPAKRWPSCTAMVAALEGVAGQWTETSAEQTDRFAALVSRSRSLGGSVGESTSLPTAQQDLNQLISDLIADVAGERPQEAGQEAPAISSEGDVLRHRFQTRLPLGSARIKLDAFSQQWYANLIREDGHLFVFHVNIPSNFWRKWIGRQPGLEVQMQLTRVHALGATPIEVSAQIRAFRCNLTRGRQLLEEIGLTILDSLRSHLLVGSNKRLQNRILWPHPVIVRPVYRDGTQGEAIECVGKDISQAGMGFYLAEELDTSEVLIQLPNSIHPPTISVPAALVRAKRTADGSYEVGALFRIPALRKALPELASQS
jgi:serine/threonine protein kinase